MKRVRLIFTVLELFKLRKQKLNNSHRSAVRLAKRLVLPHSLEDNGIGEDEMGDGNESGAEVGADWCGHQTKKKG